MNSAWKAAALVVLSFFVAGCRHKTRVIPPPAAQAPIVPVSQSAKNTPPPQLPAPQLPKVGPPGPQNPPPKPKPHKTVHHKPKHTEPEQAQPKEETPPSTEQASNGGTNDISPIGQLSAPGEGTNTRRRQAILDEINATDKGLNDIKRSLSKDEQLTAAQIRTFLTKAKDALSQEDLDGAHTLVTKAKVLLGELTQT